MSQLQNDPIRVVPKRTLLLGIGVTGFIIILALLFSWPMIEILIGYWIGLLVNLITFRLIVIGTKNFLDRKEKQMRASMVPNLMVRMILLAGALFSALQIGTWSFVAALIGISMVRLTIQFDSFFSKIEN